MKLYKFYSDMCAPCKRLSRVLESLTIPDDVELVPINVSENYEFAMKNGVTAVPVLMLENGEKLIGVKSPDEILNFISGGLNEVSH